MQYPSLHIPGPVGPRVGIWALALLALLSGCRGEAPVTTARFNAFATLVDLSLVSVDRTQAERAAALIKQDFAILEREWSPAPSEPLGRINALLPTGEPFAAPPSVLPLVRLSQDLSERSGGLFNPAIGRLRDLWGFEGESPGSHPPPDAQSIARLVAANPRMADIRVAGLELQGNRRALKLDFSAISKGAAIDVAIGHLRELGIRDALIQAGGSLRAIGDRSGQPWRVPIRRASGSGVLAVLSIRGDESVATAAAYDRNFIYRGTTYHDILDPRTGWPAKGAQSVTVVHRDAATADAAATALFVAGPNDWVGVARTLGIRYALLVDNRGTVHLNPELRERIEPIDPKTVLVLSESLLQTAGSGARP